MKKRIFSFLMAVAMVLSILPLPALAAEGCANHPVHDESCGYVAAVEGQACGHQHSDACRVETVNCTHVHTAECYPEGDMEGEPALCGYVCSEESGCVTVSCNHVHNEECGYVEAVAGQPCNHSCELCNPPEEPEEEAVCICDARCNEMVNTDCPVCAVDASQCAVPQAHEIPQAVLDVQAMIDALPSLEEVQAMTDKGNAYNQTQAAYEAYLALTEEEQAQVTGTEVFEVLFTYFNSLAVPAADITYLDENGDEQTLTESYTSVSNQTTTWTDGWYVVESDVTIPSKVTFSGNVHLLLVDGCTLTVNGAVNGDSGDSLTIYGQVGQTGSVNVTDDTGAAAIGGKETAITINSGRVIAKSTGLYGSGIGVSGLQRGVSVIINGGYVESTGTNLDGSSGINCDGGGVAIHGGTVIATSSYGSGIGPGKVEITGGMVTATGGWLSAGIGGGGPITISGGTVVATGRDSAGIGGNRGASAGIITITGGDITAIGWNPDIGKGADGGNDGTISIGANATLKDKKGNFPRIGTGTDSVIYVPASIVLNESSLSIELDETATLTTSIQPTWVAERTTVTWESSDTSIATIDENGLVTAVAPGTATITATAGGKSATCTVTVTREPVTYLDANGNQQTCTDYTPVTEDMTSLGVAGQETWYVVDHDVTFQNRTDFLYINGNVHLILKDGCTMAGICDIAVSDSNFTIYAQSTGTSMGKCGNSDGLGITFCVGNGNLTINGGSIDSNAGSSLSPIEVNSGTVTINGGIVKATTAVPHGPAIKLDDNSHIRIYGGEVIVINNIGNAIGVELNSQTCKEIYISGNAKVTDGKGQFPGVSDATSRFIGVKSIEVQPTLALDIGSSEILTPTMFPAVATDIFWSSDNESVATVDASGRVTAVSAGTANITVTGQVEKNGAVKIATCAVTVNKLDSNLPLTVKNGSEVTSTFTYGDTITVEFTPTVKAATRLAAPAIKEAALFLGTTQLTEAVTADASGKFTLTYNTADKGLSIGENLLTVQYGGSDKLNAGTADVTVTLNPKPVTVSGVAAVSRDYAPGSTTVTLDLTNAAVVEKVGTDDVTVSGGTGTMTDANAGVNKAVTVTGLTLSGTHAGFYSLTAQPTGITVTITPKEVTTPTVTVTPDSYVYTGSPITPKSVVVKDGDNVIPDTEYTVTYGKNTDVGTATLTITDKDGGNYAVSGSGAFSITQSGTGMTMTTDKATYVYGDTITATVTVTPTRTAKLRTAPTANQVAIFNGTEQLTEPQTVTNGEALTFTFNSSALGAGDATLTAQYIESGNMEGKTATASVTVTPKPLNVTLTGTTTKVYDGGTTCNGTGLTLTVEGVLDGDTVTHTAVYTYNDANVGDRTVTANITQSGDDAGNYKLPEEALTAAGTITARTVTLAWGTTNLVYTGTPQAPTATAGNLVGADVCIVTVTGEQTNAGTYTATATALSNGNYQLPEVTTTSFTINPKTVGEVKLSETSFVYDGTEKKPTVTVMDGTTPVPETEYTVTFKLGETEVTAPTDVGVYTVVVTNNEGGNYAVDGTATFAITQSGTGMTMTTDKTAYVYGETITATVTVTATGTAKLRTAPTANQVAIFNGTEQLTEPQTVTNGEALTFTFNSSALGAGNATLTAQYIESGNMEGKTATASVTVTPKPLAVTLTGTTTKVYDGGTTCNETGLTLTVEGVLDGDTVTHAVTYTFDDANVGDRTITANITLGGADAGNYALPEVALTAAGTITPKPITLAWSATDLVYTGNPQAPTATAVGIVGTDVCTVTVTGAQTNAGTYTATATALSNGDYQLPAETTTLFTINPKTVNEPIIELSETSFVYDGTEKKPTVTVMDGETVIDPAEYSVAYAKNTDVGTATVTIEDIPGGNYAVSGSATFEISMSGTNGGVTLDHANKTYIYGESVGVTVTVQSTGEAPSLLASFVNLLTGNDNTVSIYQGNICLAGPTEVVDGKAVFTLDSAALGVGTWDLEARFSGSNNMAADTQLFQVIVNQKELTVTGVKAVERDYEPGNMTVALNLDDAKLVGLVGTDEVTVTGGTGTISTDSAGAGKPVTVTGLTLGGKDAGNYILKQPEGLLVTIKQVTVTITANDATAKTGEEMPTTFGYTVDGLLGQDQLTKEPTITCDADMTTAGTYDIVPGGAEVNSNYTLSYVNGTLTVQQSTTPIVPGDTVRYIVEHYKGDSLAEKEVLGGKIGETVTAVSKNYEGYRVNTDKSTMSGTLVKLEKPEDIVILKVYYDLKVNGVSLNKTTLTLTEGNTETLTATVTPAGAVNKAVTWFSSNTDVATVDANGKVTAVKEGKATITVTTTDGGFVATCEVTVKPAAYTVTFDSNGGSAVAAQTVENGKKAAKPADPTLAKHNFKGWYTDEECTKPYDFDTPVTGNLTLHAKWAEVYTFTLNYKANTSSTVRSMPKDESVTSEREEMAFRLSYSKPKRSGYTFTGWNTQANGKGTKYQPGDDVPGIKDGTVTLYAQWKQNSGSWWDNPKTGDYIMIAVAVLAVSGVALAGLLVYAKKKKK